MAIHNRSILLFGAALPRESWLWRKGTRGPPQGAGRSSILTSSFPQAGGDPDLPMRPSYMDISSEGFLTVEAVLQLWA